MSNDGNRIYSEVVNGVKIGVDVEADIYKVLGLARQSSGYDVAYACCNEHGKINPWAKHKPVRTYDVDTKDDTWQGNFGQCGFEIPEYANPGSLELGLIAGLVSGAAQWKYMAPRAGIDWCRTTDFDGYNHRAGDPFPHIPSGTIHKSSTGKILFIFQWDAIQMHGNLAFGDIRYRTSSIADFYMGIALWNSSKYYYSISKDKGIIGSMEYAGAAAIPTGKYKAAIFLSSVPPSDGPGGVPMPQVGNYIAAGMASPVDVTIADYVPDYMVTASGSKKRGKFVVNCSCVLTNNVDSPVVFEDIKFTITVINSNGFHMNVGHMGLLSGVTVEAKSSGQAEVSVNILPNIVAGQEEPTYYVAVSTSLASSEPVPVAVTIA